MYSVIMIAMIIAIAVGAGACPMNLTLVFLLFILSIHIIAGLGNEFDFEQQDRSVFTQRAVHFGLDPKQKSSESSFRFDDTILWNYLSTDDSIDIHFPANLYVCQFEWRLMGNTIWSAIKEYFRWIFQFTEKLAVFGVMWCMELYFVWPTSTKRTGTVISYHSKIL